MFVAQQEFRRDVPGRLHGPVRARRHHELAEVELPRLEELANEDLFTGLENTERVRCLLLLEPAPGLVVGSEEGAIVGFPTLSFGLWHTAAILAGEAGANSEVDYSAFRCNSSSIRGVPWK